MISVRLISSVDELDVQLVGDRQTEQVRDQRAVQRREQRDRHQRAELGRIGHVGEHLHHADQRPDHAEGRRAVADGAIDLLPLVQMGEEVVAIALEIVADEIGIVAVGDEADALGEERIVGRDLFKPDRSGFARDLGKAGDLVDEVARRGGAHRERKFRAERKPVHHRGKRKADERRRERAAENDDHGVDIVEHPQVAAHQNERDDHD